MTVQPSTTLGHWKVGIDSDYHINTSANSLDMRRPVMGLIEVSEDVFALSHDVSNKVTVYDRQGSKELPGVCDRSTFYLLSLDKGFFAGWIYNFQKEPYQELGVEILIYDPISKDWKKRENIGEGYSPGWSKIRETEFVTLGKDLLLWDASNTTNKVITNASQLVPPLVSLGDEWVVCCGKIDNKVQEVVIQNLNQTTPVKVKVDYVRGFELNKLDESRFLVNDKIHSGAQALILNTKGETVAKFNPITLIDLAFSIDADAFVTFTNTSQVLNIINSKGESLLEDLSASQQVRKTDLLNKVQSFCVTKQGTLIFCSVEVPNIGVKAESSCPNAYVIQALHQTGLRILVHRFPFQGNFSFYPRLISLKDGGFALFIQNTIHVWKKFDQRFNTIREK